MKKGVRGRLLTGERVVVDPGGVNIGDARAAIRVPGAQVVHPNPQPTRGTHAYLLRVPVPNLGPVQPGYLGHRM